MGAWNLTGLPACEASQSKWTQETIRCGHRSPQIAAGRGAHYSDGMHAEWMDEDEFEEAVDAALDRIPRSLSEHMDNVVVFIADRYEPGPHDDPHTVLLGLYEGIPLTERDQWYAAGSLPDRITIYREPILDMCSSRDEVVHEILVTVVHEIAHHF